MKITNTNATQANVLANTRSALEVKTDLEKVVSDYTRTKISAATMSADDLTLDIMSRISTLDNECSKLVDEFNKASEQEFFAKMKKAKNPAKSFFANYVYKTAKISDVTEKKSNVFEKRTVVYGEKAADYFKFEKYLDVEKDKISAQKVKIEELVHALTLDVAKRYKCEEKVKSNLRSMSKDASEINLENKVIVLQEICDAIFSKENGKSFVTVDETDVHYLEDCFTRKGREICSIKVLKENAAKFIIFDMIHAGLKNCGYTVTGYKIEK